MTSEEEKGRKGERARAHTYGRGGREIEGARKRLGRLHTDQGPEAGFQLATYILRATY